MSAVHCGLLTIEHAWSRDHATSSVTAVLPPPGQCCGTVCLNSFGNRTSPSNNSNDRWKRLPLVSRATAPCLNVKGDDYKSSYLLTLMFEVADVLVHEVKSSVREQWSKATAQLVVRILSKSTFLHRRKLTHTGPDLLGRCSQLLYKNISMTHTSQHVFHCHSYSLATSNVVSN